MKKKIRVYLLFFILSITPFIRGCNESFGFPFPALNAILVTGSLSETIRNLISSFGLSEVIIFFEVNLLVAYLLSRSMLRSEKRIVWKTSFLDALAINLAVVWIMVALLLLDFKEPSIANKISEAYFTWFGKYLMDIPKNLADNLELAIKQFSLPIINIFNATLDSLNLIVIDATSRAWFIVVTFLLAGVIYILKKIKSIIAGFKKPVGERKNA